MYLLNFLGKFDGVPGRPGMSQKEGEKDQGEVTQIGGTPLAVLRFPGPSGFLSGSCGLPRTPSN